MLLRPKVVGKDQRYGCVQFTISNYPTIAKTGDLRHG